MGNQFSDQQGQRKEPSFSTVGAIEDDERVKSAPAARPKVAKQTRKIAVVRPGLFWSLVIALLLLIASLGGIGYMTYQELRAKNQIMAQDLKKLLATSDQIGEKLNVTDVSFEKAQRMIQDRVNALGGQVEAVKTQLKTSEKTSRSQFEEGLKDQVAQFQQENSKLTQSVDKDLKALESRLTKSFSQNIIKETNALTKKMDTLQSELENDFQATKRQVVMMSQGLSLLEEQMETIPLKEFDQLQNQLVTYMQSMDRFRQQTNATFNDFSQRMQALSKVQKALSQAQVQTSGVVEEQE